MAERGKKVNKNNPANRAARGVKKRAAKADKAELIVKATEGIAPRKPIDVPAKPVKPGVDVPVQGTASDLLTSEQREAAKKAAGAELKAKLEDVGPSQRGRARRLEDKRQTASDEAAITEARREKTPSEQAAVDAASAGTTVEDIVAVRAGNASFIDQKPKTESNFEPVNLAAAEADQPKGSWSPATGTGIFTPAPTGAVRGNRAQPTAPAVQENTEGRIKSGMGLSGLEEGTPLEIIKHPVHGDMEVPANIARAHRLYDLDFQKNSGKANRLAGLEGSEDYAGPYQHKGGHYERLGRLQAAGENPDDISAYARKMGQTEFDMVESRHALLQDKIDSSRPVNYGLQHLHEDDTFTHPDTGETHPISAWESQGMHMATPAKMREIGVTDDDHKILETAEPGMPSLIASKGTNTSVYKDSRGDLQTTVPTHIGWWKTPTDGKSGRENLAQRPGNWSFKSSPIPLDANPQTTPLPAYDFTAQQTREAIPIGSKQSRAQIGEAARAMAQIAAAGGVSTEGRISNTQVTDPTTGRALEEPNKVSTTPSDTYKTTDTPAEDPTVYKRSGRGKNVLKDVSHLVSQQMATTVGGGPVSGVGEAARDVRFGAAPRVPRQRVDPAYLGRADEDVAIPTEMATLQSTPTNGASAFQPGKTVVAGTAAENQALSEKLRTQEDNTGSAGGRGFGSVDNTKPTEMPSYRTDVAGNPMPNPPTVGRKGDKRLFVRGRSATGRMMPKPLQKFFEPVNAPADGAEGPQPSSGSPAKAARRNKRTGALIQEELPLTPGRTAYATPLSPTQAPLTESQQWIQAAMPTGKEPALSKPTMTATEASKYSRINLEKKPSTAVQPMLDFGQPEREEENKRAEASKANGGVDATTGKKFKRSGQQWGFLDQRWIGNIGGTDEALADTVSQENRAKGSEYPRAPRPAPAGLPKAGPKSAPVDTDGAGPAAQRILGDMGGSQQLMDAAAKAREYNAGK